MAKKSPYLEFEGAKKLLIDLLQWLKIDKPENTFYKYFLAQKGLYPGLLKRIEKKFPELKKWFEKAKYMQEAKICKYASESKLHAGLSMFILKNHHDYKDKSEQVKKLSGKVEFEHKDETDVKKQINQLLQANKLFVEDEK